MKLREGRAISQLSWMGERTNRLGLQLKRRDHSPPAGEDLLEAQGGEGRPLVGRHLTSAGPIFLAVLPIATRAAAAGATVSEHYTAHKISTNARE